MELHVRSRVRAAARRVGIHLPFSGVICASGSKTVSLEADGRTRIRLARTLVFLDLPEPDDLHDTYAIGPGEELSALDWESPDALELRREWRPKAGRVTVYWRPREPITRHALYVHEHDWVPSTSFTGSAVSVAYRCDMRTGVFTVELATSVPFETVICFKRPRWPRLSTERSLARYALKCLRQSPQHARLAGNGTRAVCEFRNPKQGDEYIVVAFRRFGVVEMEERLRQTSVAGRLRRLAAGWTHALTG
jgi:hypothetical protein